MWVKAALFALVVGGGCKKSEAPPPETHKAGSATVTAPPPAAPKFATPEAKLERYLACVTDFNAGKDSYAGCFGRDAVREQIDSVPASIAKGPVQIGDAAKGQHASYPDLNETPRLVIVNGNDILAILYVSGTNTGSVEELAATGKKLGVLEAEHVTMSDDGAITRDNVYVDQPTIYHQLGLIPNDTSPDVTAQHSTSTVTLIGKNDAGEAANKAVIEANLAAINKKDTKTVAASAAAKISLVYHGDKQKIETKKAFLAWLDESVKSTSDGRVDIKSMWTAGDYVVVADTFTGTPTEAVAGKGPVKKIESQVLEFFRLKDGKLVEQQIFGNRLLVAVELGMVSPEELATTLSKHK